MAARARKTAAEAISVVPADEAGWDDLQAVFGPRGYAARCQCQHFKIRHAEWRSVSTAERAERLRAQTGCGNRRARRTSGLVAYLDGEPVGWCAVEPRTAYARLLDSPVPWPAATKTRATTASGPRPASSRAWASGAAA